MTNLKLIPNKPVKVTILTANPPLQNGQYGNYYSYSVVDHSDNNLEKFYQASEGAHAEIQQMLTMGPIMTLIKETFKTQQGQPRTKIKALPEGDIEHQMQPIQPVQQPQPVQQGPDWDKIKSEKGDDILKGQCRNQAIDLICSGKIPFDGKIGIEKTAYWLYQVWTHMDWSKVPELQPKVEGNMDTSLPF